MRTQNGLDERPKRRKKKLKKKYLTIPLLFWLCFQSIALISYASPNELPEQKETMYVTVFFAANPGELNLVKNIHLVFENSTIRLPVNTSLEVFNKGFVEMEYALTPEVDKFFLSFNIFFEPSISNETADLYADDIVQELLKIFDRQDMELLWENQGIQESKMWVHRSFGYKPYSKEEVSAFLKYKPTNGFGRFIDGLISKYVPGDSTTKLYTSYSLKKTGSDFYWTLKVTATTSKLLAWDVQGYSESININELLNNNEPLIEISSDNQRIIILIQNSRTFQLSRGLTTYNINIQRIQPEGYTITDSKFENWPNTTEIRYEPPPPIENIVVDITMNSLVQKQESPSTLMLFGGIVAVLVVFLAFLCFLKRKLKRR